MIFDADRIISVPLDGFVTFFTVNQVVIPKVTTVFVILDL